jgi:hypothetical protein
VKQARPEVRILVGGPEITADNDWVLERPEIDFAVIGEGEQTFCELLADLQTADVPGRPIAGLYVSPALAGTVRGEWSAQPVAPGDLPLFRQLSVKSPAAARATVLRFLLISRVARGASAAVEVRAVGNAPVVDHDDESVAPRAEGIDDEQLAQERPMVMPVGVEKQQQVTLTRFLRTQYQFDRGQMPSQQLIG